MFNPNYSPTYKYHPFLSLTFLASLLITKLLWNHKFSYECWGLADEFIRARVPDIERVRSWQLTSHRRRRLESWNCFGVEIKCVSCRIPSLSLSLQRFSEVVNFSFIVKFAGGWVLLSDFSFEEFSKVFHFVNNHYLLFNTLTLWTFVDWCCLVCASLNFNW